MPKYRNDLNKKEIIEKHLNGRSVSCLSKEYNVSRKTIARWIKQSGVQPRGIKDANRIFVESLTLEERKAKTLVANNAVRGREKGNSTLIKRALYYEKHPDIRQSRYERMFTDYLVANNIVFKPQKAFERYNIDFAFEERKIALEIFGGIWHGSGRKVLAFNRKSSLLLDDGWSIVVAWCRGGMDEKRLFEYINTIHDREPKHHVLSGFANKSKIGAKKIIYRL